MNLPNNFLPMTPDLKDMLMGKLSKLEWVVFNVLTDLDRWGDRQINLTTKEIHELVNQKQKVSFSTVRRALIKLKELGIFTIKQAYQVTVNYCYGIKQLKENNQEVGKSETTEKKGMFKNEQEKSEIGKQCSDKISNVQNKKNQNLKPVSSKDSISPQTNSDQKDFYTDKTVCEFEKSFQEKEEKEEEKNKPLPSLAENKNQEGSGNLTTNLKQVDSNTPKEPTVLEKVGDKLKLYGVYLNIYDRVSGQIIPNPKMEGIKKMVASMNPDIAERAILAYLAWLKDAINVNDPYAALAVSLRKSWT